MCTSCRVLSTYNQGDIEFTINSALKMDVSWNKKIAPSTAKDEKIVEAYIDGLATEVNHLFFINQPEIAKWFFSTLIRSKGTSSPSLAFLPSITNLDVRTTLVSSTTTFGMNDPRDYLVQFIHANKSVTELKVMQSDFPYGDKLERDLKDAWNNRGLTFVLAA